MRLKAQRPAAVSLYTCNDVAAPRQSFLNAVLDTVPVIVIADIVDNVLLVASAFSEQRVDAFDGNHIAEKLQKFRLVGNTLYLTCHNESPSFISCNRKRRA